MLTRLEGELLPLGANEVFELGEAGLAIGGDGSFLARVGSERGGEEGSMTMLGETNVSATDVAVVEGDEDADVAEDEEVDVDVDAEVLA